MILRNLERQPLRSGLSSLGIAFSVAILLIGLFMFDGIDVLIAVTDTDVLRFTPADGWSRHSAPHIE